MAHTTPLVENGFLYLQEQTDISTIPVGSREWCRWLEKDAVTTFHFKHRQGNFTARREHKSNGHYWYAYRKRQGHLSKVYLGKAEELLLARLEQAALLLATNKQPSTFEDPSPTTLSLDQQVNISNTPKTKGRSPLLSTKLFLPPTRPDLVVRSQLLHLLDLGNKQKLTLLSAPAGFGKTTLLSTWQSRSKQPYAWLSLDKGDNDPLRFWLYLSSALQKLVPAICTEVIPLLENLSSTEAFLTVLLNTLADADQKLTLLLDDYHLITTQTIHDDLSFLLENLPPRVHFIIATRIDPPLPLTRLRARGQLCEIRAQDLRFSTQEATTFLCEVMHLNLSHDEINALDTHIEGWVAGLQLAALSMQGQTRASDVISAFTGNHRYVLDYLTSEVLQHQPEHIRTFLLYTAILERLNAPLCNVLTGQQDGQAMLEQLENINLFLIPLDTQRQWYRYHHLFAEFLRERLRQTRPELLPTLHLRASHWYEQQHLLPEAITHALQAQDMSRSLQLIEDSALDMMKHGEVTTFLYWLRSFPEEAIRSRARLRLFQAGALIAIGQLDNAEIYLQEFEQTLVRLHSEIQTRQQLAEYEQLDAEYAASRSTLAAFRADLAATITWSHYALEHLQAEQDFIRSIVTTSMASAYLLLGNLQAAYDAYNIAVTISLKAQNLHAALASIAALGYIQVAHGHLQQALETHQQAIRLSINEIGLPFPVISMSYASLCEIWYERNQLPEAQRYALEGIELGKRWGYSGALAQCSCTLAIIQVTLGETNAALETMNQLERLIAGNAISLVSGLISAYRALLHLRIGNREQAILWAQTCGLTEHASIPYPRDREYLILTQILLAQHQYLLARNFLDRIITSTESDGRISALIDALIQLSLLEYAEDAISTALKLLNRAIHLATNEGFVRVFVDKGLTLLILLRQLASTPSMPTYALTLLNALGEPSPQITEQNCDPLSERELHILHCIAHGRSNQVIAEDLVIALSTVKTHLSNIYRKLGVHSRTQAIASARELNLLE